MDSLPPRDFMKLFDRMTAYLDLEKCETKEDIEWEMMDAIAIMKRGIRKAKRESTKKKFGGWIKLLRILGRDGVPATSKKLRGKPRVSFARRTIEYAKSHPQSRISLVLQYGKKKAQKILRKRKQKRLETLSRK